MLGRLLGVQKIDFTNQNGQVINGINLYVSFPDENVEGLKCGKFFIKDNIALPKNIKLNDKIDISFNYKGKIESVTIAEK